MRSASLLPAVLSEDWQNGGFGLYIHWPFCQAKCPYCDFNSHVSRFIDEPAWLNAYLLEIRRVGALTQGRVLNSVFFGGGTPSLMSPDLVHKILDAVRETWTFANNIEISLEANPGSVEAGRFAGYADAGVNRISMGVQALNDRDLARLGRIHTVAEARAAFDIARSCFDRVSFDLIYARQDQTMTDWRAELNEALSMAVDHVSLYQLTIESGTAFGDRYAAGKLRGLPDDDLGADMYLVTQEVTAKHGMPAYEVSNHARDGAASLHNLIYWRYGDYAGIGPGAHGRLTIGGVKWATESERAPGKWLQLVKSGSGEVMSERLTNLDMATEFLLMGMRLTEGVDPQRFRTISGKDLNNEKLGQLEQLGMIEIDKTVKATDKGRAVLNAVISELLPE